MNNIMTELKNIKSVEDADSSTLDDPVAAIDKLESESRLVVMVTGADETVGDDRRSSLVQIQRVCSSSRTSDTESMDRGDLEGNVEPEYDENIEIDSLAFTEGDGYVRLHGDEEGRSIRRAASRQCETPPSQPSTVAQRVAEQYRPLQCMMGDFFQSTMEEISLLEQDNEHLRLQNKDLVQQVKNLKAENKVLMFEGCKASVEQAEDPKLRELQEHLRQAVRRMYEYKGRCEQQEREQLETHQSAEEAVNRDETSKDLQITSDRTERYSEPESNGFISCAKGVCTVIPQENHEKIIAETSRAGQENCIQESGPVTQEHVDFLASLVGSEQCEELLVKLPLPDTPNGDDDDDDGKGVVAAVRPDDCTAQPSRLEGILDRIREGRMETNLGALMEKMFASLPRQTTEDFCIKFGFQHLLQH